VAAATVLPPPHATLSSAPPVVIQPLAPSRYKVQFTASTELHDKLERLRALLRSEVPDGNLGAIIEQAVSEKLARLEARCFATFRLPSGARCASVTEAGAVTWTRGADAHNSYLAEHDYGREAMARHRRSSNGGSGAIAITSLGCPLMPYRTG
jgi:hypothetical protein